MRCDQIWRNARLATMAAPGLGVVEDGLVAARDGHIVYAGSASEAPALEGDVTDCAGRWITPGLIDCHTHLVYGGNRTDDFVQRLAGASYAEIARKGGGIRTTMRATRDASAGQLLAESLTRLTAMAGFGITTVEIKSGYGLSLAHEIRQLEIARKLKDFLPMDIQTTYLAAHALPPEFDDKDVFVDTVCREWLPAIARSQLADAVDAYCDTVGFSAEQVRKVLAAAKSFGLPVKLHAEQFSRSGGAALAAEFGALSADHLEYLDAAGARRMAACGTVAVLLPGAWYFTGETQVPPVALLREMGVPIAIATDCNPGTSPLTSPLLAFNMAAVQFRLTIEECLAGMTREAARALGLTRQVGTLEAGKWCDLAIWNIEQPAELVYHLGHNPLHQRVWRGQ